MASAWADRPIVAKGRVIVTPPLLATLVATLAFGLLGWQQRQATAAVARAQAIRIAIQEELTLLVDAETGVRGYLLTGEREFLAPYERAQQSLPNQQERLRALVQDPGQRARLARMEALIGQRLDSLAALPASRASPAPTAARTLAEQLRDGKALSDALRSEFAVMQAEEERILAQREAQVALLRGLANGALMLALAINLLAALAARVLFLRGIADRVHQVGENATRLATRRPLIPVAGGADEIGRLGQRLAEADALLAEQGRVRDAALAEAEARYREAERARGETRAVLDATGDGMALVGPDRRFLAINRAFSDLFEVAAADIVGKRFGELGWLIERVFADPEAFHAVVAGTAGDVERSFEAAVVQRWPRGRQLQLASTPVRGEGGAFLGRLYVLRDVTHEREVDCMKSEFIALVSHELRTPLTSIKGFVDLLLEGDVGEVSEEQREFLEIVASNADRLVALINDLLDISRIEAGKVELHRAPLDLPSLIREIAASLRPQIEGKGQVLTLDCPPALPPVCADADRVAQILTNLLSNAHKYTPPGGALRVAARPAGAMVQIDVQDSGIGLTPEEQVQLFTKFFRAKNRMTQEADGTGLGLAITRSLVELHGGSIGVTSAPGAGATFTVALPLASGAAPAGAAPAGAAPAGAAPAGAATPGGRIVVVDDEPGIAALLRRYLERAGYRVSVAHNAETALRLAREEHPDLITLDINLPGTDGLTLLEWLKGDEATAAIPVLLLSVLDDTGRGKLLGAVDYLPKPVDERTLLARVCGVLSDAEVEAPPRWRVLVADDDRDIRTLIAGGLRRAGYEVAEAGDGDEAVAIARRERPDLILLDVRMPRLDGVAALRALREDEATRETPVIVMTASPGSLEASRPAVEAFDGTLLRKPLSAEDLARILVARSVAAGKS